jgi:hypothetical protein
MNAVFPSMICAYRKLLVRRLKYEDRQTVNYIDAKLRVQSYEFRHTDPKRAKPVLLIGVIDECLHSRVNFGGRCGSEGRSIDLGRDGLSE